eukprot:6182107-Pleurochrysis_carterae.AAC.3
MTVAGSGRRESGREGKVEGGEGRKASRKERERGGQEEKEQGQGWRGECVGQGWQREGGSEERCTARTQAKRTRTVCRRVQPPLQTVPVAPPRPRSSGDGSRRASPDKKTKLTGRQITNQRQQA